MKKQNSENEVFFFLSSEVGYTDDAEYYTYKDDKEEDSWSII